MGTVRASLSLSTSTVMTSPISIGVNKYIFVYADSSSDDPVVMKIGGGEFAFVPAKNDQTMKAYGTDVDQMVEYAVFGLDSSAVTLS